MSSCNLLEATFPCLPSTFVGWSSLAYALLPLNIAIYDLEHLYLFNCNCLKYHTPTSNSFQTGIYTYILCILSIIHAIGSFACHGCTASTYTCYIDVVALYCIYLRYYFQNKTNAENKTNAKLIHSILFSSKYHWLSTIITLIISLSLGIIASLYFGQLGQLLISGFIYSISYISFFLCEFLIRKVLMIKPLDSPTTNHSSKSRSLRLSSTGSQTQLYFSLGLFDIQTEDKKALFSLIFIIIAGCGYLIDILNIDKTCENIGHGIYHIFSAIALTFWYWSLVGEKWTFLKTQSQIIQNDINDNSNDNDNDNSNGNDHDIVVNNSNNTQGALSPNSASIATNTTDTSLRNHIMNSSSAGTYSNGHDITDTVLNMDGVAVAMVRHQSGGSADSDVVYKGKSSAKRTSFLD